MIMAAPVNPGTTDGERVTGSDGRDYVWDASAGSWNLVTSRRRTRRNLGTQGGLAPSTNVSPVSSVNSPTSRLPLRGGLNTRTTLTTERAVLDDILDTVGLDWGQYQDLEEISRGQIQYSKYPQIVFLSAGQLEQELSALQMQREIDAAENRDRRIRAAIRSAVVEISITPFAIFVAGVVTTATGLLFFTRQPWKNWDFYSLMDTIVYGSIFVAAGWLTLTMLNSRSAARGFAYATP